MFAESVPKPVLEQVARVFAFDAFSEVYVCSSGSFRFEQVIAQACTGVRIVGSDVALLPFALGTLAATGTSVAFEFVERLAFVERLLSGESDAVRVAALLVACEMGRYTGPSEFAALRLRHYEQGFSAYLLGRGATFFLALDRKRLTRAQSASRSKISPGQPGTFRTPCEAFTTQA